MRIQVSGGSNPGGILTYFAENYMKIKMKMKTIGRRGGRSFLAFPRSATVSLSIADFMTDENVFQLFFAA